MENLNKNMFQTKKQIKKLEKNISKKIAKETLEKDYEKVMKLEELKDDIGKELFSQLSEEEKQFIIETEGIVDFGYELTEEDLKRITKSIGENYEY